MSWRNKKVLITGGAGFIGSNLAIRLVAEGAEVSVLDAFLEGSGANAFNLAPVEGQLRLGRVNLDSVEAVVPWIEGRDVVFHLAGLGNHQDSMEQPRVDLEANVATTLNVLEACRRKNPAVALVFTSTRQIYGSPQYLPVDEKHPIVPPDVNAVNKVACEQLCALYHRAYGLRTISLRLTNTYGSRQLIRNARQGVTGWFMNRALLGEQIQLFGGGEQQRDFNEVDDVVEALLRAAVAERGFGVSFNLSGERASLGKIAESLVAITGKGEVVKIPFPAERKRIDIGDYYGSSTAFEALTGWAPRVSLSEGIARMAAYYQEHQEHYLS